MKVLLTCTEDEFGQIKQLEDDPNVPLVIDSSEDFVFLDCVDVRVPVFDEGEKVFYDVDLDISPDGFSSFDLVVLLLHSTRQLRGHNIPCLLEKIVKEIT